jgi:hypothetical protein
VPLSRSFSPPRVTLHTRYLRRPKSNPSVLSSSWLKGSLCCPPLGLGASERGDLEDSSILPLPTEGGSFQLYTDAAVSQRDGNEECIRRPPLWATQFEAWTLQVKGLMPSAQRRFRRGESVVSHSWTVCATSVLSGPRAGWDTGEAVPPSSAARKGLEARARGGGERVPLWTQVSFPYLSIPH